VAASLGCISWGNGGVIITFGNETYTIPLNTTTNTTSRFVWEKEVEAGKTLVIYIDNETIKIKVDYEVRENKFAFFVTLPDNTTELYYEPVNTTLLGKLNFYGEGSFVGTTYYLAKIRLEANESFEVKVT